jgi:hypothetical protein
VRSRQDKKKRKHSLSFAVKFEKPLLQIDQMILFVIYPGKFMLPDRRCLARLVESMQDTTNIILQQIMPTNVQYIFEHMKKGSTSLVHDIMHSWWLYNNQPHFLMHPSTAKLVRNMLKHVEKQSKAESASDTSDSEEDSETI